MKLYTLIAAATILGLFLALLCPRCGQAWFGRWWRRKTYLGCGCLVGTHESTIDAIRENHPDVVVPDMSGLSFYGGWSVGV